MRFPLSPGIILTPTAILKHFIPLAMHNQNMISNWIELRFVSIKRIKGVKMTFYWQGSNIYIYRFFYCAFIVLLDFIVISFDTISHAVGWQNLSLLHICNLTNPLSKYASKSPCFQVQREVKINVRKKEMCELGSVKQEACWGRESSDGVEPNLRQIRKKILEFLLPSASGRPQMSSDGGSIMIAQQAV